MVALDWNFLLLVSVADCIGIGLNLMMFENVALWLIHSKKWTLFFLFCSQFYVAFFWKIWVYSWDFDLFVCKCSILKFSHKVLLQHVLFSNFLLHLININVLVFARKTSLLTICQNDTPWKGIGLTYDMVMTLDFRLFQILCSTSQ